MSPARAAGLVLLAGYWLANAGLHLAFSTFITSAQQTPFGAIVPIHYGGEAALALSALLLLAVAGQAYRGEQRRASLVAWTCLLVAMLACNRWLLTTPVESIHYLQYGIIGWLLAWVLDPRTECWPVLEIVLIALCLSFLDELYQYLYLTARQGSYFDFNDLLLNQLGVMAGLLCYYGFRCWPSPSPQGYPRLRRALVGLLIVLLSVIVILLDSVLIIDPPGEIPPGGLLPGDQNWRLYLQREPMLFGNWSTTFFGGLYYVLSPPQGLAVLLLCCALCSRQVLGRAFGPAPVSACLSDPSAG